MSQISALREAPKKEELEDPLSYAIRLARDYIRLKKAENRKLRGQFFTPKEVSAYMANMFTIGQKEIKILDPGAGTGILSAALCNRLAASSEKQNIEIDAFENDPEIIPYLRGVLDCCKTTLQKRGHFLTYRIFEHDFIIYNEKYFERNLLSNPVSEIYYDYVISNPPYYKLEKSSQQAKIMRKVFEGHPNIYALFMTLSVKMLKDNGELVFITPRSFCSGLYFKNFRRWFINNIRIDHVHIFESRRDIFNDDGILQENILLKGTKTKGSAKHIEISVSRTKTFDGYREIGANEKDILYRKNEDTFIRIPASEMDLITLRLIDDWPKTLQNLGLEISTGPVVDFRTKDNLRNASNCDNGNVPLLWMHNLNGMRIKWPLFKNGKPMCIAVNADTRSILLPVKNYILVKRFSSKEQKKRLSASVMLSEDFSEESIGIENHVNYIYKKNGELSKEEALGLAALLNSSHIDNYFRSLNGNTQVNATDLRSLPLPNLDQIQKIGEKITDKCLSQEEIDAVVSEILKIKSIVT